jgi:hypothetical protein
MRTRSLPQIFTHFDPLCHVDGLSGHVDVAVGNTMKIGGSDLADMFVSIVRDVL